MQEMRFSKRPEFQSRTYGGIQRDRKSQSSSGIHVPRHFDLFGLWSYRTYLPGKGTRAASADAFGTEFPKQVQSERLARFLKLVELRRVFVAIRINTIEYSVSFPLANLHMKTRSAQPVKWSRLKISGRLPIASIPPAERSGAAARRIISFQ